ncbi:MAG: Mur ligase, partial [Actinobacteria bacterium]|nr:Mur ligase [Actinomycetota bacterium]
MARASGAGPLVRLIEVRVLDGPNVYFTRPAVKLTLDVTGWLRLPQARAASAGRRAALPRSITPGAPGTDHRRRFVARLAAHLLRRVAGARKIRLAVRWRPGPTPEQIVIAYPWRRRAVAEATGELVANLVRGAADPRANLDRRVADAARKLDLPDPGPFPDVPSPTIPVIAVTGTNGKTTVVRLLAHIGRTAGLVTAYSCTDGVYLQDDRVEEGDYSGFAGAGMAISQPGVELAILETARGGILLRGMGTTHNDVSVVTNISPDHLGMHGIETLDQLAEVKSAIVRITRREGWTVLNADDPRVIAMRRLSRARAFAFALHPDNPWIRATLDEGGRAMSVIDGSLSVLAGSRVRALLPVEDIPMTIAGLSSINLANAMAGAAAALGVGLPEAAVVEALRTFVLDPERNPGRMNLWELDGRAVVVDYAHNEAGLEGLLEVCVGLRPAGKRVWITIAAAGDRSDAVLHGLGRIAARRADHVGIAELLRYLRGRDREEVISRMRDGAFEGGKDEVDVYPDELGGLGAMLKRSSRGDVVAVAALA